MTFKLSCLARINGKGFSIKRGKLVIDDRGYAFLWIPLTPGIIEELERLKETHHDNDGRLTNGVLRLASSISEGSFVWGS